MISSAMSLNSSDLDRIGQSKAKTYRGQVVAVVEHGKVAIVQGYKPGLSINDCLPTCIRARDLDGLAKACYGTLPDF